MILFRLLIVGLFLYVIIILSKSGDYSFVGSGSTRVSVNFGILAAIWFVPTFILFSSMSVSWNKFAKKNGFEVQNGTYEDLKMRVPSFRGKRFAMSLPPIGGTVDLRPFSFFTRAYKEGGVLRWRERKMDTILSFELTKAMPHIAVDSRYNEKARQSNLNHRYGSEHMIHFEGNIGDKYNVYTGNGNEVVALQLFTPDVLEVFFEKLPQVDIETKDHTIWFIWRYGILNDKLAQDIFLATSDFLNEFMKQLEAASIATPKQNLSFSE
jgi:hypothetical protein